MLLSPNKKVIIKTGTRYLTEHEYIERLREHKEEAEDKRRKKENASDEKKNARREKNRKEVGEKDVGEAVDVVYKGKGESYFK